MTTPGPGAAGSVTAKVVPSPGVEATSIVPPCRSTSDLTIERPRPVPGVPVEPAPREKRSKTCSSSAGVMPRPVSEISIRTPAPSGAALRLRRPPSSV